MTTDHPNHARTCDQVRANPKFQRLTRQRSMLAWSLSGAVLAVYYSFIMVVAFAPAWLHRPLYEGSHLSLGMPIGVAIILLSWLLTASYVHTANTRFDALSVQILQETRA
ncbi:MULTISPECIES: DUF485 domain-containing protein [Pseudomonas]|uniref:DUF485 domain-containing protein n=1 Tax=Pseudomonas izuensis TaxID=2684212 RepID=A0ABM7RTE5_9PSED|nr:MULTISPECIES: DUF485 domain-containing protein [Pseudomonas]RKS28053.1 uncharacterized membrane protein (DUF485 family) [Pseudomonas sp. WPR_5_2]BCX68765.1 DUF485 domain-containing protein [Pseudomonas izuensis]